MSCQSMAHLLTPSQTTILNASELKKFANDNFIFNENGKKFSRTAENTMRKGEIACYEQFLLFPWCFTILVLKPMKTRACLERVLPNTSNLHFLSSFFLMIILNTSFTLVMGYKAAGLYLDGCYGYKRIDRTLKCHLVTIH